MGGLLLAYTLAPPATTAIMLDHPVMRAEEDGHRRRGLNVASAAVRLLADFLPAQQARLIPHPRAAALTEAVWDLPEHRSRRGPAVHAPRPGGQPRRGPPGRDPPS